jgi:hypothetical protein
MRNAMTHNRISTRLHLYQDEVARLPIRSCGVRVREGVAWMTVSGEDQILRAGQAAEFTPGKFPAVVMAMSAAPLILEVLGCDRPQLSHVTQPPFSARTAGLSA